MGKANRQRWTEEHDAQLRELWPRDSAAGLKAAFPGRSKGSLLHRASKLGIKRDKRGFSDEALKALGLRNRDNPPRKGRGLVAPVFVRDGVEGKVCVKCLEWLPLGRFPRHATCAGGRRNGCTLCASRNAYAQDPEREIAKARRHQKKHPEAHRERKRASDRRRHGQKVAGPGVSVKQYRAIREAYGGLCAYCGEAADTMDHVIPLSRGGEHSPDNLVPACRDCNFRKHTKTGEEFLSMRKD